MFKNILVIVAGILMLIVIVSYFLRTTVDVSEPRAVDFVDITSPVSSGVPGEQTSLMILNKEGQLITITNVKERADQVGTDAWVFAGGFDVENEPYALTFYESYNYFQISLEAEPLAEVRVVAEQAFLSALNLDKETACSLDVSVRTRAGVNEFFAGQELGLSFCPDAVLFQ